MKKIALYIAKQQDARLKALAKYLGITQAELFRRFLEEGLVREEHAQEERLRYPWPRTEHTLVREQ